MAPTTPPLHSRSPAAPWPSGLNALTVILLGVSALEAWLMLAGRTLHANDFRHLWLGAYLLRFGRNPYDAEVMARAAEHLRIPNMLPFVYLPTTGLLLRPLVGLGFAWAQLTWFVFNWALAWGVVVAGPWWMRLRRPALARLAGAAFLAGAMPFFRDLTAGQMNVVGAALLTLAAGAIVRRRKDEGGRMNEETQAVKSGMLDGLTPIPRNYSSFILHPSSLDFLAGAALAVGFAWKIAPALPLLALGLLRRRRALAWGAALCALALGVSLLLYGWPIHRAALVTISQMGYGHSTGAGNAMDFYREPFNESPNSLLHHLVTNNPYSRPWVAWGPQVANRLTVLVSLLIAGAWLAAWWAWRRRRADDDATGALRLYLASTLVMLLLPSLMWDHYAVQTLPALLWLFGSGRATRGWGSLAGALAIFALLTVPVRSNAEAYRSGVGILVMALRLWPTLALYGWLLRSEPGSAIRG